MRNKWYGDNRDLVKWSILIHLAKTTCAARILQIAFFRHDNFAGIEVDGRPFEIPPEVIAHFRTISNVQNLSSALRISVFDTFFKNRGEYLDQLIELINSFPKDRCIIFLDPDTGLEPAHPNLNHVLVEELEKLWAVLKSGDLLVFCQHQTNRNGAPWIEPKRKQFEKAIKVPAGAVKVAHGLELARDVAFYYVGKP